MSSLPARARADLKEAWAGGAGSREQPSAAQQATVSRHPPTDGSGSESSREERSRQRESGATQRPPLAPAPAPSSSGQHEAPDSSSAPTALGALRRGRGWVQMQVLPEGAQDPLQRREEAGNEAKVPALRGEDGYHHHQKCVKVPGSGALPASQTAEHQAVHQVVQCLEREAQGLRRIGWKKTLMGELHTSWETAKDFAD